MPGNNKDERIAELEALLEREIADGARAIEELAKENARLREIPMRILDAVRDDPHLIHWPSVYEVVKLVIEKELEAEEDEDG